MLKINEVNEKVLAITSAYERVCKKLEGNDTHDIVCAETNIDKLYKFVMWDGSQICAICRADNGIETYLFDSEEDDWTIGDLIGAYLDLYFER